MPTPSEIRQQLTSQIIEALTNGKLPPWRKPWSNDPNAPGLHTSLSTGNPYRGINQILLQLSGSRQNLQSKWWGTFNQVNACGAHVRRGQKGTQVVLFKPIQRTRLDEQGEETDDSYCVLRTFVVFNAEQTDGLKQFRVGHVQAAIDNGERHEHADAVVAATGAEFRFGGNKAFYSLDGDFIQMPFRQQFNSIESYYETAFHELVHWSEKRVGFDRTQPENSDALGELIAEIGSCFLMGELGLPTTDNLENHAAYLKHWLRGMSGDSRFIFRASAQATKAVEFLMSFSRISEPTEKPVLEDLPF